MPRIIGIDFGTTKSVAAVMDGDRPRVVLDAHGSSLTPSAVAFTDRGDPIIGELALHQQVSNPSNTILGIKRLVGRRHSDLGTDEKAVPYTLVRGPSHEPVRIEVCGKTYSPSEISAMILKDLKKTAENYLGEKIERTVITVPTSFNRMQRAATRAAAELAGLRVERIINASTAAALAYGLGRSETQTIAVLGLGGGTFDISIMDIGDNVHEVLSVNGDRDLGGNDYDQALISYVPGEFRADSRALQWLALACERAKRELSMVPETTIDLPIITSGQSGPRHIRMSITRETFERLTEHLTERVRKTVLHALKDARRSPSEIDRIVLVGGGSRMPAIQRLVTETFGKEPNCTNIEEAVAIGAAIQGTVLAGEKEDIVLLDVASFSLGVESHGGIFDVVIERNTSIPTSKEKVYSTADNDQTAVAIRIFEGDRKMAEANLFLGTVRLDGIPPTPRGVPQIAVTFDIDANQLLTVSARDKATGKNSRVAIPGDSMLGKVEDEQETSHMEEGTVEWTE